MKKLFLFFLVLLLCISLVNSQPPFTTTNIIDFPEGYVIVDNPQNILKQNQAYKVNFFVYNSSTGNAIDNSSVSCVVYIAKSNGEVTYFNNATYSDGYWQRDVPAETFNATGYYGYGIRCQDGGYGGSVSGLIEVTPLGVDFDSSDSILYVGFIALFILLILGVLFVINMLPQRNTTDEEGKIMSISYLKYFRNVLWLVEWMLVLGVFYLSSNLAFAFLQEQLFAKTLFMVFHIMLALTPVLVIVWIIWIFASMFHDKQFQNMLNRGMFPQGNL